MVMFSDLVGSTTLRPHGPGRSSASSCTLAAHQDDAERAVLAGSVVALEEDPHLAAIAREKLAAIVVRNVTFVAGPLMAGAPA